MDKCARCRNLYKASPYLDHCATCGDWLEDQLGIDYDERQVASLSDLASRIVFGERLETKPVWRCA